MCKTCGCKPVKKSAKKKAKSKSKGKKNNPNISETPRGLPRGRFTLHCIKRTRVSANSRAACGPEAVTIFPSTTTFCLTSFAP